MQSLTALIREANADDPLARSLEAILNSGLIIFSRATDGHFVQLSETLSERAGIIADPGSSQPRNMRVFDETGRLLPGSEYPAAITRMTGTAQRDVLRRLVSDDDREIWLKMSTLPIERGPEGWSVLTVGTDVTELREEIERAQNEIAARGALLELSLSIPAGSLSLQQLPDTFRDALATLLPGINVSFAKRDGNDFETIPLLCGYGRLETTHGRYTAEETARSASTDVHVNRNVQDTDIYGSNVMVEYANVVRSIAIAPCHRLDGERIGSLAATSDQPGAFTEDQLSSLKATARILSRVLQIEQPLERAG